MKLSILLTGGEAALGTVLAVRPEEVARTAAGPGSPAPPAWVVRVLGLRMAAQGMVEAAAGKRGDAARWVRLAGAAVDGTHAASMVAMAAWKPAYRRSALLSAGVAAAFAAIGVRAAPEPGPR